MMWGWRFGLVLAGAGLALPGVAWAQAAPALPQVIYGPPVAEVPASAPAPRSDDAASGPVGRMCRAYIRDTSLTCALAAPRPLGAECACPFPPPPPGLAPSPPAAGNVVP